MFRDDQPMCPCCDDCALAPQAGFPTRLRCDGCRGIFVQAAEVEAMIVDLVREPWSLDANLHEVARVVAGGGIGALTCPLCKSKMATRALFSVEIDRCPQHGVWFDGKELAMVLEAATGADPFLIEDGPQYAERSRGQKLLLWLRGRHHGPHAPRRPPED